MANGLQVISFRDSIPVSDVTIAEGITPRSLRLNGQNFKSVIKVLVNDVESPDFIVVSRYELLVQIPTSMSRSAINDVEVISGEVALSSVSHIDFGMGPFNKISGIARLLQNFLKILLQAPGSDIYNPNAGGNVLGLLGTPLGRNDASGISASISRAITSTERFMIEEQSNFPELPPDEKLMLAELDGIDIDPRNTTVSVRIRLLSMTGESVSPVIDL